MKTVRLGDIAEFQSGYGFPTQHQGIATGDLPFAKVSDISRSIATGGTSIDSAENYVSQETASVLRAKPFAAGTIVFAKIGEAIRGNRRAITAREMLFDNNVMGISVRDASADIGFVFQFLRTLDFYPLANSTAVPSIRRSVLEQIPIPLPSLDEQRRIAAILDQADALRQKRKRAIELLDSLTQSIFLEMFGDPAAGRGSWASFAINQICTLVRGSSPRPQGDPRYFGGPVPRLMIADITRDGFWVTPKLDSLTLEGAKKSRPAPAGTVVMAVSGDVGLVSRLAVDACIHDGFFGFLELDETRYHPVFFRTVLHLMKNLHTRGTAGAIFQNTTTTEIKKMTIPCPPLELQMAFLSRANLVEALSIEQRRAKDRKESIFASLQDRAFSGQL